ncbi:hypothetical protein NUW58_g6014 [Xylaria curta]|uniref:Uncharacterized protein n=1 Tax=Xylaria curta TaxID=42375 RepID=A0ACC1P026_9PEZI|nr:hypothetical protein NUW58_g6014 [Xylaria curta]
MSTLVDDPDQESTNPFSEGHVEKRLLFFQSSVPHSPDQESTVPFSEGHVEKRLLLFQPTASRAPDQESTVPFSEGHVERRPPLPQSSVSRSPEDIHDKIGSQRAEASGKDQDSVPITDLEAHHLKCRLLIQPQDPSIFKSQPGRHELLRRRTASSSPCSALIECIAITQGRENASYLIVEPLHCQLYYDSEGDSVTMLNHHWENAIMISEVTNAGTPICAVIGPSRHRRVNPGAWAIRQHTSTDDCMSGPPVFQLMIYPRMHSLSIVDIGELPVISGSKRKYDNIDQQISIILPKNISLTKTIDNLGDVKVGELVRVATGNKEDYQIRRLPHTEHNTRISSVYKATVTMYPRQLVVVKFIKGDNAEVRAKSWQREFRLHSKLQSDVIVPLLGADARFSVIYLKWIDAYDLGHNKSWRQMNDHFFLGNEQDAAVVLRDMARALEHLEKHEIVHHDIKPANILYSRKTGAVLIDFGLGSCQNSRPHSGGTPWYIGPEYLRADGERQSPEDVWALGVVMLYLLRLLPLPESGKRGKGWVIKQAREPSSQANNSMRKWLDVVQDAAKENLDESNQLHRVVQKMLIIPTRERIKPREITDTLTPKMPLDRSNPI